MRPEHSRDEFTTLTRAAYRLWFILIRYLVPPALLLIFIMGLLG
jgi:NSS family neurotransmitter:Na+ symporter